jgi:MFS family permease
VLIAALALCGSGVALTLAPNLWMISAGLALFACGVFFAQAASSSHVAHHAESGRGLAIGMYATFYYIGGTIGGGVPAWLWKIGRWPACVAFVLAVQCVMLAVAWRLWEHEAPLPEWSENVG